MDDDEAAPSPTLPILTIQQASVTEGDSGDKSAPLTVTLSSAHDITVTVNYSTTDGTASSNTDYTAANGILTFAPGQTTQTIVISIHGDSLDEGDETVLLSLSNPVSATLGTPANATLTIVDDDEAANPQMNERIFLPSIQP